MVNDGVDDKTKGWCNMKVSEKTKELMGLIEEMKKHDFRCFVSNEPIWQRYCIYEKKGHIGYVERGDYGWNIATKHKPNQSTGTGFSVCRDSMKPEIQVLYEAFEFAPNWVSDNDLKTIKKYSGIDEYIKQTNANLVEV